MTPQECYEKYKHLDHLLSDPVWCNASVQSLVLHDIWEGIKAARTAPGGLSAMVPCLMATEQTVLQALPLQYRQECDLLSYRNASPWTILAEKYPHEHALAVLAFIAETRAKIIVLTKYKKEGVA